MPGSGVPVPARDGADNKSRLRLSLQAPVQGVIKVMPLYDPGRLRVPAFLAQQVDKKGVALCTHDLVDNNSRHVNLPFNMVPDLVRGRGPATRDADAPS